MHRIKIESPANVFMEWIKVFVGGFIIFQSVLLWWYYSDRKAYRILAVLPFKMLSATLIKMLLKCVPKGPTDNNPALV